MPTTAKLNAILLRPCPIQNYLFSFIRQFLDRRSHTKAMRLGNGHDFFHIEIVDIDAVVWSDGSFSDSQIVIKHQLRINLHATT